jgi:uncharacterized membrane protein YccC
VDVVVTKDLTSAHLPKEHSNNTKQEFNPFYSSTKLHATMNITLDAHLRSVLPQDGTREALISSVIPRLLQSIADVAQALRNSHHVAAAGTANTFGDHRVSLPSLKRHNEHSLTVD